MKTTTTLKVVHRLLIEKPQLDPAFEDTELHAGHYGEQSDSDVYFPDFGI